MSPVQVPPRLMRAVVRAGVRPVLGPDVPVRRQRRLLDLLAVPAVLPTGTYVAQRDLGGRPAERIAPRGADGSRAVLYLHGGGYTVGSLRTHQPLAAHLAAAAQAPAYLLDYRLAPEHPYPAAVDDAAAAYDALLDSGIRPDRIAVAGDSAGGGLALALMLRLKAMGTPLPAALGLVSPWTDLRLAGVDDDPRDPMLRVAWLAACAERYAALPGDLADPEVSPILGDLTGLPPTLVHGSSDEILLPGIEQLVWRLHDAGVEVGYRRLPGLWHVAHLQAGLVAPATDAVHDLGRFLGAQLISPQRTEQR